MVSAAKIALRPATMITVVAGVALWWLTGWIAARALIVQAPMERADVILVLSGSPAYRERLVHAGRLFADSKSGKVLLTDDGVRGSWSRTLQKNPFMAERGKLILISEGVPVEKIEIMPGRVRSTIEEAIKMRRYAEEHRLQSVMVVTSGYHSRRALWTLRQVFIGSGIEVGIDPAPPMPPTPSTATWWMHRRGWSMVANEYVKLVYYRLRWQEAVAGAA